MTLKKSHISIYSILLIPYFFTCLTDKFEGFDTRVLEFKLVTNMTGTLGRKMRFSAFVVVGNKNGLAGKFFNIFADCILHTAIKCSIYN